MSAAPASLTIVPPSAGDALAVYEPHHFTTSIDLSDLNADERFVLTSSLVQFRLSQKRLTEELCLIATHLMKMKEILGDTRFYRFADEVLQFNKKRVSRLLRLYRVLDTHFKDAGGRFHPNLINNFSQSGLLLLTEDTDAEVIDELKQLAEVGVVTQKMVEELLEKRDTEERENVGALTAELAEANRMVLNMREQVELAEARAKEVVDRSAEVARRLTEQRDQMEEELTQVREQPPKVEIKEVTVLPKEYQSEQQALADIKEKYNKAVADHQALLDKAAIAQKELLATEERMQMQKAGADEVSRLREQVNLFMTKFSPLLLTSLTETNPLIKNEIVALGKALISAGTQLKGDAS